MEKTAAQIAGGERSDLRRCGGFVEFESDSWVPSVKFAKNPGKDGGHGQPREGDANQSTFAESDCACFCGKGGQTLEQRFNSEKQGCSDRSQVNASTGAFKQAGTPGGLKLDDCTAECRLSDSQRLRSPPEVEVAGDFSKVNQVAQIESELILSRHHRSLNKYFPALQLRVMIVA